MKLLLFLFVLSSCATQKEIKLNSTDLKIDKNTEQMNSFSSNTLRVKFFPIETNLNQGNIWGEGTSKIQYSKIPVVYDTEPAIYLREFLINEFLKKGIKIVSKDEESDIHLILVLDKFWVKEVIEKFQPEVAKCEIAVNIIMKKEKADYQASEYVMITSAGDLGSATDKLVPTIKACMEKLANDILRKEKFNLFIRK